MQSTPRRWLMRERTAREHAAVDSAVGNFDNLADYKSYLASVAAFRASIERQVSQTPWPDSLRGWQPTTAAEAIAGDLDDLDMEPAATPALDLDLDGDRLFGTLYVVEGSALGARLLLKRAQALGLTADYGARHLSVFSGSLEAWRGFLDRLERADPFDLDSAVSASVAAFALARDAFGSR